MLEGRVLAIARYELLGTVTRLGYLLTLLGMPLFIGALVGLSTLVAARSTLDQLSRSQTIGVVDEPDLFGSAPDRMVRDQLDPALREAPQLSADVSIRRHADLPSALRALRAGEVSGVVRIPRDYLARGALEEYTRARSTVRLAPQLDGPARALRPWIVRGLLEGRTDPAVAARAARPAAGLARFAVDEAGAVAPEDLLRELRPLVVPLGFALLLLLSIFTSASYLATGLTEEKQNRALELLLTSVTPEQLFWGKLIGLWLAALLQFLLYLALVALPASFAFAALGIQLSQALVGLAYFVLGFFFFGAVLLGVGAVGNTQKYTTQLSGLVTMTALVPCLLLPALLHEPSGRLARTLTYVPFTAPITGMLRGASGALPLWELLLSLACLGAGAALAVRASAKVFRVALLATGATPSVRQLWRWLTERA